MAGYTQNNFNNQDDYKKVFNGGRAVLICDEIVYCAPTIENGVIVKTAESNAISMCEATISSMPSSYNNDVLIAWKVDIGGPVNLPTDAADDAPMYYTSTCSREISSKNPTENMKAFLNHSRTHIDYTAPASLLAGFYQMFWSSI